MPVERTALAPGRMGPRRDRDTRGDAEPDAPLLQLALPCDAMAVRAALAQVMARLAPLGLTEDCRGQTELVLAEVLNNVVEHAYAAQPGPILLEMRVEGSSLACRVRDEGLPMPDGIPPAGGQALLDVPLDSMPEGGFGWFLIRSLTRNLRYVREVDGNQLTFLLPLERCLSRP